MQASDLQASDMQASDPSHPNLGWGRPCFIIAEAGVNHNGSLDLARQLVDVASAAGADAVKFQTFKAARLVTPDAPQARYQAENTGSSESQFQMLQRLELSEDAHRMLLEYCRAKNIVFMSTPFDEQSADFLDGLGMGIFKTPSGELTNLPFLAHIAHKGKPMIVSTGMSSLGEVEAAVGTIEAAGNRSYVLLHCVSNYPARPADANLRAMHTLETAFHVPVGFSDHTPGIEVALAAAALGACVIEKHFTLDRQLPGPDHKASLEPGELHAMVRGIRMVESALGDGRKVQTTGEAETAAAARRSLVAARTIPAGTQLTHLDLTSRRPGTGLPPAMLPYLLGRTARLAIPAGAVITLEMLS